MTFSKYEVRAFKEAISSSGVNSPIISLGTILIPDIIRNCKLYLVDGKLKGKINAKYVLRSTLTNTNFSLCIDEDIRLNRFGQNYCCIFNLVDDNYIKNKIDEGLLKEIRIKRIIKKELYGGKILEITYKAQNIYKDNPIVTTIEVSMACVGYLLLNNCAFSAVYIPTLGNYHISYFRIDASIVRALTKFKDENGKT